jgi:hypothetical protein
VTPIKIHSLENPLALSSLGRTKCFTPHKDSYPGHIRSGRERNMMRA